MLIIFLRACIKLAYRGSSTGSDQGLAVATRFFGLDLQLLNDGHGELPS